jgi:mycothiol system anti-sigma-R factor
MKCKEICEELVFRYTDNEMEQEMRIAFKLHVADCPECKKRAEHTERFLMIVRKRTARTTAPRRLRQRLLDGLRRREGLLS